MNENKNNYNENSNDIQSTWSKKILSWMTVDMPKTSDISDQNFEFDLNKNSSENNENEVPKILINNTDTINTSNEFSSLSDSTETHLVTITRLQEKGGLGNLIRKLRTGFKKDDNLTRFWMPDSNSKECSECNFKFSTLRRKHHCRICGQIFCSRCCSKEIDGSKVGYLDNRQVRSCDNCFKAVSYCDIKPSSAKLESSNDASLNTISEINSSYEYLPQTFRNLFKDETTYNSPYNDSNRYKTPRRSIEENLIQRRSSMIKNDNTPVFKLNSALKEEKRSKRLFFSSEENLNEPIWDKEIDQKENISFENIETEIDSADFVYESDEEKNYLKKLYKNEDDIKDDAMNTFDNISNDKINLNKEENFSEVDSTNLIDLEHNQKKVSSSYSSLLVDDHLNEDLISSMPSIFEKKEENELKNLNQEESFDKVYEKMFEQLTCQLLKKDKLNLNWYPVLRKIVIDVTKSVKPNNDILEEMDIRRHVKIKTITGGNKSDSCIINGVVFTKNVAHRKMRKEIENPKILLLSCPITYQQRMYQKFISFEKLFLQENNYLENLIEKIVSFKSNIIILDKIVSTKAQELLLKKKITLIFNVKSNILYKIARLTGGEIISSIDAQITTPKFGECSTFYLKTFSNQTLMFFDGCKPESGCTILLRGSVSKKELKKVKNILQFLVFCNFNWKYEKEFLLNSSAYLSLNLLNEFSDHYDINKNKVDSDKKNDQLVETNNLQKSSLINLDPLLNNGVENKLKFFNFDTKNNNDFNNIFENSHELNSNMCSFIKEQILNISPFLFCKLPYLLTNESESCSLKQYLTNESLFNSISFKNYLNSNKICLLVDDVVYKKEEILSENIQTLNHPFLTTDLKYGPNNEQSQELRAMFRSSDLYEISNKNLEDSISEENETIDPFDIMLHQLFPVLYCNYSLKSNQNPFCMQPRIILMEFYVKKDFSLGDYLKNFCFTTNSKCDCGSLNIDHISKFSHACGSIHVRCKKLEKKIDLLNSKDILTWSWCQLCKTTSPSQVLSKNALSLSFGKLLQLKIYGNHFRRLSSEPSCSNHSLFHDHFQFFAYQNLVASFKYYPVIIREIVLPCFKLNIKIEISKLIQLSLDFQKLKSIGYDIMSKIVEKICAYQAESEQDNDSQFKLMFKTEMINRSEFKSKIVEIQDLIQFKTASLQIRLTVMNKLILLKKFISSVVNYWNINFNDFETCRKKEERSNFKNTKTSKIQSLENDSNLYKQNSKTNSSEILYKPENANLTNNESIADKFKNKDIDKTSSLTESTNQNEIFDNFLEEQLKDFDLKDDENSYKTFSSENEEENSKKVKTSITESSESISSIVFGLTPGIKAGLGKEIDFNFESDKENYEVVHSNIESKLEFEKNSLKSSNENTKLEEIDEKKYKNEIKTENNSTQTSLFKSQISVSSKKELNVPLMKTFINTFLSVPNVSIIQEPFDPSIHYLLPTKEKLPIILNDNDVGSIIAYTLTTIEYERKLSELKTNDSTKNKRLNSISNNLNNINNIENIKESLDFISSSNNISQNTKENSAHDINVQFSDNNTNYFCCIYFAHQFCELRSDVLTVSNLDSKKSKSTNDYQDLQDNFLFDTEEAYIRSISQTIDWLAKGGKSNALFGKTLNDRFVIKIVSKTDLQFFLQMAKSYFSYIKRSLNKSKPTLFAKIIGAYHVSWKNNLDNSTMKKYVLVMENLFYNRNIKQKFDLKGSEKNRLATTKTSDDVLLDENLTKIIRDNPFYVLSHSKKVLKEAIDNDSKFLCYLNVIDYSLLVGIDEEKKEIVLGIIDYLQTYTNIKKIENVIKSMGKVMPTVVDPKSYRIRFQSKMNEYFQCLPDQWYCFDVFSLN